MLGSNTLFLTLSCVYDSFGDLLKIQVLFKKV